MKRLTFALVAAAGLGLFAEDAYIEGTGTQAILTDVRPGPTTRVEADFQLLEVENQTRIFGGDWDFYLTLCVASTGKFCFYYSDKWRSHETTLAVDTGRHTAIADMYGRSLAIMTGGVTNWSATAFTDASYTKTCAYALALFGASRSSDCPWDQVNPYASHFARMRLYSCKVYESGALTHCYKPWKSGSFVGLKDLCTGRILVNVLNGLQFVAGGDITDDPAWDPADGTQPTITEPTIPTEGTYTIDLPRGAWYMKPFASTVPVVKAGKGILVLDNGNTFGAGFSLTNGAVMADYAASGLAATHVSISGPKNIDPGIIMPVGATFSPTVGTSGAGTIQFSLNCGIRPATEDLKVSFPNGELTKGSNGFSPSEWDLGLSPYHTLTFANDIRLNASTAYQEITIKNPGKGAGGFAIKRTQFTGRLYRDGGSAGNTYYGQIKYWDGPIAFVGQKGRTDDLNLRGWNFYCGDQLFTNCVIRGSKDWYVGGGQVLWETMTLKDCDFYNTDSWDSISSQNHAAMTVDGGTFDVPYRFLIGRSSANQHGALILTNNAQFTCGVINISCGTIDQYSGTLSTVKGRGDTGRTTAIARQGDGDNTTPVAGVGKSVYNLHGGTLELHPNQPFQIGAAHLGILNQEGGTVHIQNTLSVGSYASGTGRYDMVGGKFLLSNTGAKAVTIGESGQGTVTVEGSGAFETKGSSGVILGANAGAAGTLRVRLGGEVSARAIKRGNGAGTVLVDGGTLKPSAAGTFLDGTLGEAQVSPLGGVIDTTAGDATVAVPLVKVPDASGETMLRRWAFKNGSAVDSLHGVSLTKVGSVTAGAHSVTLSGGDCGTSQLSLGTDLIPTDGRGFTFEMWFQKKAHQQFARIFQTSMQKNSAFCFVALNQWSEKDTWYIGFYQGENRNAKFVAKNNVPYHLSFTFSQQTDGCWRMIAYMRDATTGELLDTLGITAPAGVTLASLKQSEGNWIGNGPWGDPDPSIEVFEIRTHGRVLTTAELDASVARGANHPGAFAKRGANTLTLTGANTYCADTAVEAGTLALGTGVTLPETALSVSAGATLNLAGTAQTVESLTGAGTVKGGTISATEAIEPGGEGTVGTLTLDGAAVADGALVLDVLPDASDTLVTTGELDLSKIDLVVKGTAKTAAKVSYTLVSGPVTGAFRSVSLPRGWRLEVTADGVFLSRSGCILLVR